MVTWTRVMLLTAGGCSMLMALYHFFLPVQFQWDKAVLSAQPIIGWALIALNFFFSTLLLLIGGLVFFVAWHRQYTHQIGMYIIGVGFMFWLVNFVYLLVRPMPMPDSLIVARVGLVAFSAITMLLHGLPVAKWSYDSRYG